MLPNICSKWTTISYIFDRKCIRNATTSGSNWNGSWAANTSIYIGWLASIANSYHTVPWATFVSYISTNASELPEVLYYDPTEDIAQASLQKQFVFMVWFLFVLFDWFIFNRDDRHLKRRHIIHDCKSEMTQNYRHCLQEDCPGNSNILNCKETCTNPCRHVEDPKVVRVLIMAEFSQEAILKDVNFRSTDVK